MRRENSAVVWREPRGELARDPRRARLIALYEHAQVCAEKKRTLIYTSNGVLDMTRKPISRKFGYKRVQAWRQP